MYIVSTLYALAPRWRCFLGSLRPSCHEATSSGLTSTWYPSSAVYDGNTPRSIRLRMVSAGTPNLRDAWAIVRRVVSPMVFSAVSVISIIFHYGLKRGLRASLTAHGALPRCCATVFNRRVGTHRETGGGLVELGMASTYHPRQVYYRRSPRFLYFHYTHFPGCLLLVQDALYVRSLRLWWLWWLWWL